MVQLTITTAAEKALRKAQRAKQALQSSGYNAPTDSTASPRTPRGGDFTVDKSPRKSPRNPAGNIADQRAQAARKKEQKRKEQLAKRQEEIKQKEIQANRKKLLNFEYMGDGLTKDEMDEINAMDATQLSNAVAQLPARKKAREEEDNKRRQIRDARETDGQTLTQEELDDIANMSTEELKAEIERLEKEIEDDEFEASRRRDVDDTDAGVDTDEEEDTGLSLSSNVVSVSKAQLQHSIEECHRAYFPDDVPESEWKKGMYRRVENDGSVALIKKHVDAVPHLGINAGTWEISFRGTQFPDVKTGIYNAIADLNSHVISLDNAFNTEHSKGPPVQFEARGITTVGFAKHLDLIFEEIMAHINTEQGFDIITHGHSLGAVSAQLFALRLFLTEGRKVKRVYAFASPRGFDTIDTFVSKNIETIHLLDERDPITYMYPIFYESHAGFKIIQKENDTIEYLNDDVFVPWCYKDYDESMKVYNARQLPASIAPAGGSTTTDEEYLKYWDKQRNIMNQYFKRVSHSFLSFVKQWQFGMNREAASQFLNRIATTGDEYHYIPKYRELIEKLDDAPHFFTASHVDYKGMKVLENTESLGKEDFRFTEYWQLKSSPTLPKQIPEQQITEQQKEKLSENLADYITADMLVNGFIVFDENAKIKHENNFILY